MPAATAAGRRPVHACAALRSLLAQGAQGHCPELDAAVAGGH